MKPDALRFDVPADNKKKVTFSLDGEPYFGFKGDTLAAALYAQGKRSWRTSRAGDARGVLCGMGICYDCQVIVNGMWGVRACQIEIQEGMQVETSMKDEIIP